MTTIVALERVSIGAFLRASLCPYSCCCYVSYIFPVLSVLLCVLQVVYGKRADTEMYAS